MKRTAPSFTRQSVIPLEREKTMSELVGKQGKDSKPKDIVPVETGPIEMEEQYDFTPEEISRMMRVKADIAHGRYSDITTEHKKLLFVQWLIEHGKLQS